MNMRQLSFGCVPLIVVLLTGCGRSGDVPEVRVPAHQNYVIAADKAPPITTKLPDDQPFNIHIKKSQQKPGATGDITNTRGESDADGQGHAHASAEASAGGSASADFTLGHRIDYRNNQSLKVTIELTFAYEMNMDVPLDAEPGTNATATMTLMVVDNQKRVVSQQVINQANSDEMIGRADTEEHRVIQLTLDPDHYYDVMLSGNVMAETDDPEPAQSAGAHLAVRDLKMKMAFAPQENKTPQP